MRTPVWLALAAVALAACAAPPAGRGGGERLGAPSRSGPTLSLVLRNEPDAIIGGAAARFLIPEALFTASLGKIDRNTEPQPVLVEQVPLLNTDTWRVMSDGRMETTYRFRSSLTWHNGAPLTAEDFVFNYQRTKVFADAGFAVLTNENRQIEQMVAVDPRTLLIRWLRPYAPAAAPAMIPIPQHILQSAFDEGYDAFTNHPYWHVGFVGAGPYRLDSWQRGVGIDGVAFDGYALGRPKIDRVHVTWTADPNAALVRLLAGDAHVLIDNAIGFQQTVPLRQGWAGQTAGVIILNPTQVRYIQVQARPDLAKPGSLLDVRVRRALLHAIDRQELATGLLGEDGVVAHSMVPPTMGDYQAVDRSIRKYPFDLRQTEQLLSEVGYAKGSDGVYTSPTDRRFALEVRGVAEGQEAQELQIISDMLRRAGMDPDLYFIPTQQRVDDNELKSTYPGLTINTNTFLSEDMGLNKFHTDRIGSPANRWSGTNRTGWSSPEFDRLYGMFTGNLDRKERSDGLVGMMRLLTDELPGLTLFFAYQVVAHTAALSGPEPVAPMATAYQNVHLWEWR